MNGLNIAGNAPIGGANGSNFEIRDLADLNSNAKMGSSGRMSTGQAIGFFDSRQHDHIGRQYRRCERR
jgi:hypothetical protein